MCEKLPAYWRGLLLGWHNRKNRSCYRYGQLYPLRRKFGGNGNNTERQTLSFPFWRRAKRGYCTTRRCIKDGRLWGRVERRRYRNDKQRCGRIFHYHRFWRQRFRHRFETVQEKVKGV